MMNKPNVVIYTIPTCADCHTAKKYFHEQGIEYLEKDCTTNPAYPAEVFELTQMQTVPTLVINDQVFVGFIDNFEEIKKLLTR